MIPLLNELTRIPLSLPELRPSFWKQRQRVTRLSVDTFVFCECLDFFSLGPQVLTVVKI